MAAAQVERAALDLPYFQARLYELVREGLAVDETLVVAVEQLACTVLDSASRVHRLSAEARRTDQAIMRIEGHSFDVVRDHMPIFEFPSIVSRQSFALRPALEQILKEADAASARRKEA